MQGRPTPGVAVYRVVLRGAIVSALFKHAKPNGRGFWGDPPGTGHAAEAEVVGPIVTTEPADLAALWQQYEVPALIRGASVLPRGPDICAVVAELMSREPDVSLDPCDACRYRTGHALDCPKCEPWWNPPETEGVWVRATEHGHELRLCP